MSHLTQERIFIEDLDALAKAVGENDQLVFDPQQKSFRWYAGKQNACEGAIRLKGKSPGSDYEIGVCRYPQGTKLTIDGHSVDVSGKLHLEWDSYGWQLAEAVGGDLNRLHQRYAYHALHNVAAKGGYRVVETATAGGEIQLAFHKAGVGNAGQGGGWSQTAW